MLPKRYWHEMTTVDFSSSDTAAWIAVLPVCAIEQHGPHLPVYTDTAIAEGHIAAVIRKLPANLPVAFLPTQAIGKSNEHIASPGTLTMSHETLTRAWLEIGDSVARAGVRKLVIVNSHGGNVPIIDIVARELRVKHSMLAVATSWSRFGQPKGLYSEWEGKFGIHGGDMETSVMLALRPDLVKMELAEKFHSAQERFEQRFKYLRGHGTSQFGWMAQDLGPAGTVGDASIATVAKGQASLDHMSSAFVELLEDVHAFDLNDLFLSGTTFK
jgi:creatinine amidohydrolase